MQLVYCLAHLIAKSQKIVAAFNEIEVMKNQQKHNWHRHVYDTFQHHMLCSDDVMCVCDLLT